MAFTPAATVVQEVPVPPPTPNVDLDDEPFTPPVFDMGGGLTSLQVWPTVLALLRQSGVPATDVDLWLRPLV